MWLALTIWPCYDCFMSTHTRSEVTSFVLPRIGEDREYASSDPLTSSFLLSKLYYDFRQIGIWGLYPDHLSDLATNPSLPPDVFSALYARLKEYETAHTTTSLSKGGLSYFFINPLTTFDHVLDIAQHFNDLNHWANSVALQKCETVVEIFDILYDSPKSKHNVFFSNLLLSPFISAEDFNLRVRKDTLYQFTNVCADPRFVPNTLDYEVALASLNSWSPYQSEHAREIFANPNADPHVLTKVIHKAEGSFFLQKAAYDNLNCPLELSATFHLNNLTSYAWRPSYLLKLEAEVDGRLRQVSGEGPWGELPLTWKLNMFATSAHHG